MRSERLLRVQQVAQILNLGDVSIYRWIKLKHLPVHRWGKTIRIDLRDLDLFIDQSPFYNGHINRVVRRNHDR